MSKSAGNVVLIQDLVDRGIDPLALRLCFLENRYRSQMDLTWASLDAADSTIKRWRKKIIEWGPSEPALDDALIEVINNDLDMPKVIQYLRTLEKDESATNKSARFLGADLVLGLDLDRVEVPRALSPEQLQLLAQRVIGTGAKQVKELLQRGQGSRNSLVKSRLRFPQLNIRH